MPEQDSLAVRVLALKKVFRRAGGGHVNAVDGVSIDVPRGEMVVILGPSGCGKTSLLRCIAGLEAPTEGEIWSGDRLISSGSRGIVVPPEHRDFGMMFQSYALWPHMTVFQNVAYPLKARRVNKSDIAASVKNILETVGVAHLSREYPAQLSGGQQQRIALARCLVANPDVILFDEPLSNVDAKVREELRIELLTMQKRIGFAGLYVTHDQEEAMGIADRIVVMRNGVAIQVGPPREVYARPANRFVANFVGAVNEWVGHIKERGSDSGIAVVRTVLGDIAVDGANISPDLAAHQEVAITVRPEFIQVSAGRPATGNAWRGTLRAEMFRGAYVEYLVDVGDVTVRARGDASRHMVSGSEVHLSIRPEGVHALPTEVVAARRDEGTTAPVADTAGIAS